ncbi:glycosyltransferase [Novosphingobium sp. 9]|uniref:glycosyltransferase n=1 Tax=Novosphingobium sp. 9 TaxID=2025349 RepID=UPI0021B66094|nr:glycosyltransferase [Novosphingobium sp. 9]
MTSPVFFDSTGRRRKVVGFVVGLLLIVALGWSVIFASTIVQVPDASALKIGGERQQPLPFRTRIARLRHHLLPGGHNGIKGQPLSIAYYVPWDEDSASSLKAHYDSIDWIVAADALIDAKTGRLTVQPDPHLAAIMRSRLHRPQLHMMVQNFDGKAWAGAPMVRLLNNAKASDALIADLVSAGQKNNWQGVTLDIENLPDNALPRYAAFLAKAHAKLQAANLGLSVTVPADAPVWYLKQLGKSVDHVMLMDYDQHWQGGTPGPIAAQDWFEENLETARGVIPANKLVVALGSYGYDWHDGTADALAIEDAWLAAHDSGATPQFDPASGNSGFSYEDSGHKHTIWMLDAAATWNQMQVLGDVGGIALWRLGSEDPGYWQALNALRHNTRPDLSTIAPSRGADVEGSGEVLRIGASPTGGQRTMTFSPDGTVTGESYQVLPTPYVVNRTGGADPKVLALTFDDGPDPDWTPKILSILEAKHVPGTFFVIGENALEHPGLLQRENADGFEIGNHSYTHPNMAEESNLGTKLELNTTQRLIEAYTGRSTRLFRAPYFGDAEPTTADELEPAALAQTLGYTIVGLHVDPDDWMRPGVDHIINEVMTQVKNVTPDRSENVILLHDGGGDRSQTIIALPIIIDRLKAEGYRFVTVSQLAGVSRDAVMPPVTGADLAAVRADVGFFAALAGIFYILKWMFFFAISLGIARAVFLTALALIDRRSKDRAPELPADPDARPLVSVIIPAYNEEKVIVPSIARVLASDYARIELIVADDGSKDATSELVARHYGDDPRVRLMTLENGGKASALNRALKAASGEIVVALDADTQFLPETIGRLVRWFVNPRIGAVAGNARVGNRINLITRWQAIEYVTAQNVERRALDALGAITVVPGAVGAWRRSALDAVGGYPEDTLAEDQDLTIAIQREGWRVAYDVEAIALTEAPESFTALSKQRYRWSFGTLQCLWKHRAVLRKGEPRGLAWFGMPQAWVFQILFAAISPVIDLALLISIIGTWVRVQQHGWAQTQTDVLRMGVYWVVFVAVDLIAGWIAYRMEPQRQRFPGLMLIAQRFAYRQLMYSVVIRSISAALRGRVVGWGKLERTGSVKVADAPK